MSIGSPAVSVVLPTYNRAGRLARSIGSVLNQTCGDFELIVVDDGSTDSTREVVGSFGDSRIRYVPRERNGGVAAARNSGVRAARGHYLAFQDSDDEWLLEKLERQLAVLGRANDRSMCICGLLRTGLRMRAGMDRPQGNMLLTYPRVAAQWANGLDHRAVLGSPIAYTQSWLVPREAVVSAGGFDESLRIWDDWELLIRLTRQLDVRLLREPLVIAERVADSLSVDQGRFVHDLEIILEKHGGNLRTYPREHAMLQFKHASRLHGMGQRTRALSAVLRSLRHSPLRPGSWRLLFRILRAGRHARAAT